MLAKATYTHNLHTKNAERKKCREDEDILKLQEKSAHNPVPPGAAAGQVGSQPGTPGAAAGKVGSQPGVPAAATGLTEEAEARRTQQAARSTGCYCRVARYVARYHRVSYRVPRL